MTVMKMFSIKERGKSHRIKGKKIPFRNLLCAPQLSKGASPKARLSHGFDRAPYKWHVSSNFLCRIAAGVRAVKARNGFGDIFTIFVQCFLLERLILEIRLKTWAHISSHEQMLRFSGFDRI